MLRILKIGELGIKSELRPQNKNMQRIQDDFYDIVHYHKSEITVKGSSPLLKDHK